MKMGDFREKCENEQKVQLFAKKRTFPARGGNPSIAQGILMVLGPNSAQKCISGQNPPKWGIFRNFPPFSLNSAQFRPIALKTAHLGGKT